MGVTGPLSAALHCGMMLEGVHLFHGCGFLSTAHSQHDVEHAVAAFAATIPRLQREGLLG
jgi:glutamate-1-semialdehyde aminotransferase